MFQNTLLAAQQDSGFTMIIMMVLMFGVLYWFMIRPQNKKRKELESFREQIKKGDRVVTVGGIHGKIVSIQDTTVVLQVEEGKLRVEKAMISMDAGTMLTDDAAQQISKGGATYNK